MWVCVCVRQRLGSCSLDLTFKNSSGSLKFFFPLNTAMFRILFFTGNFLLLSLSQFCTRGYVNHWRFHENSWGCWIHFPLSLGSKNFFPQTCGAKGWHVPGLCIFTGQDLILRSLYLKLNLLCSVFPSFENYKGIFPK